MNLVLSADLHENKRHKYVDRRSKFSQNSVKECYSVPSAVLNSFANMQARSSGEEYEGPICKVSDYEEIPKEAEAPKDEDQDMNSQDEKPPRYRKLIEDITTEW